MNVSDRIAYIKNKMSPVVKLGPKKKHLRLPFGYKVVTEGVCEAGDIYANMSNPNSPRWSVVEEDFDVGEPVSNFECLIRRMPSEESRNKFREYMKESRQLS